MPYYQICVKSDKENGFLNCAYVQSCVRFDNFFSVIRAIYLSFAHDVKEIRAVQLGVNSLNGFVWLIDSHLQYNFKYIPEHMQN